MTSFPRLEMPQADSKLLQLPDEILISVVSYLEREDLLSARLTSSHLNELAQPFIYSDLDIGHGLKAARLAKLIHADDRKAKWLKSVLVSTKHENDLGLVHFPDQLRQMRNLKNLILETPDCNARASSDRVKWLKLQEQYEQIFYESSVAIPRDQRLLPVLESCTMHFVDKFVSLYPLPLYKSIFLHPTLQDLTISCCCTDRPQALLGDSKKYEKSTALTNLHLEECDFDADALCVLLKFPRALKSLRLSEGVRYTNEITDRTSRMHGNMHPASFSRALTHSVADSLEHLSISLGYKRHQSQSIINSSLSFTSLHQLKSLEISMSTLGLLISRPGCDHALYTRLPPSVEDIRVFGIQLLTIRGSPATPFEKCVFAQKKSHGLPNLKQVTYCYEYQALHGAQPLIFHLGLFQNGGPTRSEDTLTRIIEVCKQRVISNCDRSYHVYKDSGVRVAIELEVAPPGFIPPYLHHEEKPVRGVIWDSDKPSYEARSWESKARKAEEIRQSQQLAVASSNASSSQAEAEMEEDSGEETVSNPPGHTADLFELLITGMLPGNPADL